jgi:hypothetical protein
MKNAILTFLAAVMILGGTAYFARGVWWAWNGTTLSAYLAHRGDDCDFQARAGEYAEFSRGIYPNVRVDRPDKPKAEHHTVYPPYALPMFWFFFGNWSFETARLILQAGSVLALIAMMGYGGGTLWKYGFAAALLGAALPWAFSGNRMAMSAGQFSIICAGLLALQLHLQARGRDLLAGAAWAFAMLKPQIALPFAILFLTRRQPLGLAFGGGLLAVLSAFALWWTDFHPIEFLRTGPLAERLRFVTENSYSAGLWINALGISPRAAALAAVVLLCGLGLAGLFFARRADLPLLAGAAVCAVLGYCLFYHRRYDNMMLFPLALALVDFYFKRGFFSKTEWIAYGAFFVSVFLPAGIVWKDKAVPVDFALFAPIAALAVFLALNFASRVKGQGATPAPPGSR